VLNLIRIHDKVYYTLKTFSKDRWEAAKLDKSEVVGQYIPGGVIDDILFNANEQRYYLVAEAKETEHNDIKSGSTNEIINIKSNRRKIRRRKRKNKC